MAPRKPRGKSSLEDVLARVRAVRADPDSPDARVVLAAALADVRSPLVAAAAEVIREAELKGYAPALGQSFDRLEPEPAESDPGCKAKTAIVHALVELEDDATDLFLRGLHLRQMEPAWGNSWDSAAELRGLCALGLLHLRHPNASLFLAELLADSEAVARTGAARALGDLDPTAALPLLRFKIELGDASPEVIGGCFGSLIHHAPDVAFGLAGPYLAAHPGPEAEAVALALGESKRASAFPLLRDYAAQADDSGRAVAFVAITLLRDEKANAHLVEIIARGPARHAAAAIRALAHFRHDARISQPVLAAAERRGDAELLALARKSVG